MLLSEAAGGKIEGITSSRWPKQPGLRFFKVPRVAGELKRRLLFVIGARADCVPYWLFTIPITRDAAVLAKLLEATARAPS